MKIFFKIFIYLIDSNHKNKIVSFLKSKFKNKLINVIDVGAHKGETIQMFSKNFNLSSIICYEASKKNFKSLSNFKKKRYNFNLEIYNIGLGSEEKELDFFQTSESSSSTFCEINFQSNYYKRKKKILDIFKKENYITNREKIRLNTLNNQFKNFSFDSVDILKIDTEGFEFDVIKGASNYLKKIRFIYFEHHFDSMIIKNYKYSEIHEYLKSNNFKKILKIKMPLRKTFEYIYENRTD